MATKKCAICGNDFECYPCLIKRRKTCSNECRHEYQSRRMSGVNNPAYKGGTAVYSNSNKRIHKGYFEYIRGTQKKKALHRFLAEKALGRPLKRNEHVHHIDGNSLNNKPSNLLICSVSYHRVLHELMSRKYMEEHFAKKAECEYLEGLCLTGS